jgi:hypothetical protein
LICFAPRDASVRLLSAGYDVSGAGFRVASVRIDRADFPARESDTSHYVLGLTEPLLRALARGKRLQVFAEGEAEPVVDLRIGDGKKVAAFLRRCAPGRDMTCRGSLRDGGDEEERIGPCQYDYETTPGLDKLECRASRLCVVRARVEPSGRGRYEILEIYSARSTGVVSRRPPRRR